MTYQRLLAITALALSACESGAGPDIPMNIVVGDGRVDIYMEAADLGDCECNEVAFPRPGSCSFITDAGPCSGEPTCRSCITDIGVELDGQRLAPRANGGTDPWTFFYEPFAPGQLSLVIEGCGRPRTRIPLDGPAFPQTTVTADYVNGAPRVRWTASAPVSSTLATLYTGLGGPLCHTTEASEHTFAGQTFGMGVEVMPLVSRTELDTAFGRATIWRGGNGYIDLPARP